MLNAIDCKGSDYTYTSSLHIACAIFNTRDWCTLQSNKTQTYQQEKEWNQYLVTPAMLFHHDVFARFGQKPKEMRAHHYMHLHLAHSAVFTTPTPSSWQRPCWCSRCCLGDLRTVPASKKKRLVCEVRKRERVGGHPGTMPVGHDTILVCWHQPKHA